MIYAKYRRGARELVLIRVASYESNGVHYEAGNCGERNEDASCGVK